MQLNEVQILWDELSSKIDKQQILTEKIILEMTKKRYRKRIGKISSYESVGTVVCFMSAIAIIINISVLDTWYLLTLGIFTSAYLVIIPAVVLRSIHRLKSIPIMTYSIKQTIVEFTKRRMHFMFIQRLAIYLNFVLMFASLPVIVKIMDGDDVFTGGSKIWYWYISTLGVFLVVFSRWGYGKYNRVSESAGRILQELEE